jgi:hypothetical protein
VTAVVQQVARDGGRHSEVTAVQQVVREMAGVTPR